MWHGFFKLHYEFSNQRFKNDESGARTEELKGGLRLTRGLLAFVAKNRGKTENLIPFQPGISGNPNGRPKKLPKIDDLLADVLGDDENSGEAKAILEALVKRAKLKGGDKAAEIILDRAFGKPKQSIESKTTIEDKRSDLSKLTEDELRILADLQSKSGISSEES